MVAPLDTRCPQCKRKRDEKLRCWKCSTRPCVGCGGDTGSVLIARCITCGNQFPDEPDPWVPGPPPPPPPLRAVPEAAAPDPLPWC